MYKSKYKSKKTIIDGIVFDSKKEAKRWVHLKELEKEGKISELSRQVPITLIPSQRVNGRVVERACKYIADFVYYETQDGGEKELVFEDTKGFKTPEYIIKRKLLLLLYGIRLREI